MGVPKLLQKLEVEIRRDSGGPVGAVMPSQLTESQFQDQYGDGWILMDGRNVSGSIWSAITGNSNVPDARGVALRGKNNGRIDGNQNPDGDLALGTFQSHQYEGHSHGHTLGFSGNSVTRGGNGGTGRELAIGDGVNYGSYTPTGTITGGIVGNGGNETRMRNVTTNWFMRIN